MARSVRIDKNHNKMTNKRIKNNRKTKMESKPITAEDRNVKEVSEVEKIAKFYGFLPINPPTIQKEDVQYTKEFDQSSYPAEKAALLRMYFEDKLMSKPQPNMFYCERPFPGSKELTGEIKKSSKVEGSLISLGSGKNACECLSIQTAIAILKHLGYKNLEVEINSIGDKDSANEFQKNLNIFVRKNMNSFPPNIRQAVKKDLFKVLKEQPAGWEKFEAECPKSIDFLSEPSRKHFKEILEFLEILDIPYQINHNLVGDFDIGSETIFAIKGNLTANNKPEELAYGFRFNRLAKKMGHRKGLLCNVLTISAKLKKKLKKVKTREVKPQFYLVQFGPEAKLKSFLVLEELYKAGVNIIHAIAKDKLSGQILTAEKSGAPYIILLGQKEALENSVVIRDTNTRHQETVSISNIATKVKELTK